jgi:hypothetical protein
VSKAKQQRNRSGSSSITDEDRIPDCVRVLERGPIELNESTSDADLVPELEERLRALLEKYVCEPTTEGWRRLAIELALRYEPGLKIITPVDRRTREAGREPKVEAWGYLLMLNQERKKQPSNVEAARAVHRKLRGKPGRAPSIGRLANILSDAEHGRFLFPRFLQRVPWERQIDRAVTKAVRRIESNPD